MPPTTMGRWYMGSTTHGSLLSNHCPYILHLFDPFYLVNRDKLWIFTLMCKEAYIIHIHCTLSLKDQLQDTGIPIPSAKLETNKKRATRNRTARRRWSNRIRSWDFAFFTTLEKSKLILHFYHKISIFHQCTSTCLQRTFIDLLRAMNLQVT